MTDKIPRTRDSPWLEGLIEEHHSRLHAFAARRVGLESVEDVLAEVYTTAWRRRADVPEAATTWLFQTARNAVLHEQRSFSRRRNLRSVLRLVRPPEHVVTGDSEVEEVLGQLSLIDAEILRLSIWDQLSAIEIAAVLNITPDATRARLMRAKGRARRVYELAQQDHSETDQEEPNHAVRTIHA